MAKALKCDRCGMLYEHYRGIRLKDGGSHYCGIGFITCDGWESRYDFCPECMTKVVEFMKNDEVSNG